MTVQKRSANQPTLVGLEPLSIPKSRARVLEFATQQELSSAYDTSNTGYSARVWAQVCLPYRDPGNVAYWERRNGAVALTMRPALLFRDDAAATRYEGFAYGMLPRQALTWISTEAVRTQNPVVTLGPSMSSFMAKIGLSRSGKDADRLTDQMKRLFGSQLSVTGLEENESGSGERTKYFHIAEEFQLWQNKPSGDGRALWNSEVTLSDRFYHSIIDAPVPVNLLAMKALGSSPMRMDIYLWATYRVYNLKAPSRIKWADVDQQFGAQYKHLPQFKAAFIKHLREVLIVYPDLNIEPTKDYLIIRPSPPHVTPTKRRLELI